VKKKKNKEPLTDGTATFTFTRKLDGAVIASGSVPYEPLVDTDPSYPSYFVVLDKQYTSSSLLNLNEWYILRIVFDKDGYDDVISLELLAVDK